MNLFKTLLLAPAALGLLSPLAANAGPGVVQTAMDKYSAADEQVTSISQFSDVKPTDWAYQALSNLVQKYGCVAGYPNGTYGGGKAMTRYEAAALLNACLDRVTEVTDELKKLMKEFEKELAVLKGRVDGLEARVGVLEANQFSTTTKLKGIATFVLGANSYGGDARAVAAAQTVGGATTFNYDVRLNFDTSFTGKDLLRTTLRAGNFGQSSFGATPLNATEVGFQESCGVLATTTSEAVDCGDVVAINRLFYQFPIGSGFTATVGARVRQDDMLAMWPSVYPGDSVLDIFTYAGAPGAYSLNLGGGAGITYAKNGLNASLNYVSANADNANPSQGGIGTDGAASTFTAQLGYAGTNYGLAFAYTYGQNGAQVYPGNATGLALSAFSGNNSNYGLSAYWSPKQSGFIPSISTGWGYSSLAGAKGTVDAVTGAQVTAAQNWYVGLQWADAFLKGNTLGMAVGQPTFATSQFKGKPNDGNYAWEWWYKFQVTDNISVTPAIYYLSAPLGAQGRAVAGSDALNNFGGLVKTTFKF
jgi:hypothetical protein